MEPGWFVAPIMAKIINTGFQYLKGQYRWQTGMKKELQRLQDLYPKIKAVEFASSQAQLIEQNPDLNQWLWQLRDAIDEADDVLDEFEYMNHKRQVTKSKKQRKVRSIMKSIKKRLVKIVKRALQIDRNLNRLEEAVKKLGEVSAGVGNFLHLLEITKQEQQEQQEEFFRTRETGPLPKNDLIGRGNDKEIVMQWLKKRSNEDRTTFYSKISLLSIVGHGGMGKTTLLQHVFDKMTKEEFNLKIWVCVSNNFDAKKVIADMLEYHNRKRPRAESLGTLQESLKSMVMDKKFLLVLDDIWAKNEEMETRKWDDVLAPLANGSLGSKILITTREHLVASMIAKLLFKKVEGTILRLEGLEEDKCLQLLNSYAFVGVVHSDDHKKLRSIAGRIVKKLSGSPLAAKVIGGVLNSSLDKRHWLDILNSDIGSAEQSQNGLLSVLKLSYLFLPKHLQNCFAFCCIFPQDHIFYKDDLVRMWIALDFIQPSLNQEGTMEDIGGRYFDVLVKKSLFDEYTDEFENEITYKMHDLLHDLAQSVSAQECFRVVWDTELDIKIPEIPETIRHLSVETENLEMLKKVSKFKRLRSLFLITDISNEEIVDTITTIFQSLRSIRLLYISSTGTLGLIPETIENLVHLRYLMIHENIPNRRITLLPSSLSNLYHLQFIICHFNLETFVNDFFPRDMNNLYNLRILKLPLGCFYDIHGIGKLRSLQELNEFHVKNEDGYSIQELEHMNELCLLSIKLLNNVKDAEQACNAKLCDKRNLTDLSLAWDYRETSQHNLDLDERVLDNLQPHSNLQKLRIHSYMGVRSPIWLNNANLMFNLEDIELDNCLEWQTLPPFGQLPFLKSLYLRNMPKAKSIDYKYHRNEKDCVFPSLELLHIRNLDALEDWFDETITDDCLFPCLTELDLSDCSNLKELPCLPPMLKSLVMVNIGWKTLSCRSISKSIPLEKLIIESCPNITCIPHETARFAALRFLTITKCPNLISLGGHQEVGTTENCQLTLNYLSISHPSVLLMEPLRSITSLQRLWISYNDELVSFPSEVEQWFLQVSSSLRKLWFVRLKSLRFLPSSLERFSSLKFLFLEELELQCLPSSLSTISSLELLSIEKVPLLQQLPDFPASLAELILDELESLQCLPSSLSTISSLKKLWIKRVPLLQQLTDLPSSLKYLIIEGCHEELKERYNRISGFDRDKLAHIPDVRIS